MITVLPQPPSLYPQAPSLHRHAFPASRHEGEVVSLEAPLLKILACPIDKGELLYFDDEELLYNPRLRRRYRISDDVPLMLADQSEAVTENEHARLMQRAGQGTAVSTAW
jgi:uncharacterized protein YbaR (Trm112 family)